MNFFTPELGPPLAEATPLEEWRSRVTAYLNGLREVLDTHQEAFLSQGAQVGNIWAEQSTTATAIATFTTTVSFSLPTGIPFSYRSAFTIPLSSNPGWQLTLQESSQTAIVVLAHNVAGSSTNTIVTVRYF